MKKLLKLLLKYQLKLPTKTGKQSGFTLLELLVGIIISALVLLPLLGFMINLMETDRKEQAKTASEQEIQAALNYISRDVEQAIFIYDGFGLKQISSKLPNNLTGGSPVLVFWKRKFLEKALPIKGVNADDCKPNGPGTNCDDGFVYSLVAYYLVQDAACTDLAWSCTARIARYEFKDRLQDLNNPDPNEPEKTKNIRDRDPGFAVFNLSPTDPKLASASLEDKMNAWPNPPENTPIQGDINDPKNKPDVLIDYIDQTLPGKGIGTPVAQCPETPRSIPRPDLPSTATDAEAQATPYLFRKVVAPNENSGFYACVDADKTTAQVFIRGNALSRMSLRTSPRMYTSSASVYYPQANIIVQGRGFLNDGSNNQ
jgi:prepilin-type N-terminal cleavage/methylation domain-containing protein